MDAANLIKNLNKSDYKNNFKIIKQAWQFSEKSHKGQKRNSGENYFTHPVSVAAILSELNLDINTIVTGLLHDVVEDCNVEIDQISALFGTEVAKLVDGVTKLSKIEMQSDRIRQAENFRKLFLATSNDIRVLLVKLADRTHNMRTIGGIKNVDKRQKIAQETLEIFAPLSERVGLISLKNEMEDLSFAVVQPQMRSSIINRLSFLEAESKNIIPQIIDELRDTLTSSGVNVIEVSGRLKTAYSIWQKMQRRNVPMDQLSDIMAFRILVDDTMNCYTSLGLIHSKYPNVMGRFKDYISTRKRNGYQSLHTDIIGPFKQKIEIQIKTLEMHKIAETGIASHWFYKQNLESLEKINNSWVEDLVSILDQDYGPEDFLENTKLEMYADQVFCFTPNGDLIALPRGASPIDFAYAVHSDIGHTCVGVKINGKPRQLKTFLELHTYKTNITFIERQIATPSGAPYTIDEIRTIEADNRTSFNTENTISVFIFFANGDREGMEEGKITLGTAYQNTSMVIFEKTIQNNTQGFGAPDKSSIEITTLTHEFGHLFGLVDIGSEMQNNHLDPDSGGHCNVEGCLMRAQVEFSSGITGMLGNGIPDLGPECIADLQANGGR